MSFPCSSLRAPFTRTYRVIELFAGVGGFRFGLERVNQLLNDQGKPRAFDVIWANQWEPGSKKQHAARVYEERWAHAPVNRNIFDVVEDAAELANLHALAPNMLVAGFPCQDYSVAKPASKSAGIEGKKGVLWWAIVKLLQICIDAGQPVETLLLENVDRLLASPAKCPGRDFAIILASLQSLGYAVSWQVVNAADYGFPQRRKRVFITAVHRSADGSQAWTSIPGAPWDWLAANSPLAKGLPVDLVSSVTDFELAADVLTAQEAYTPIGNGRTRFASAGVCMGGHVWAAATKAKNGSDLSDGGPGTLGEVVARTENVPPEFFLDEQSLERWRYLKGAKSEERVNGAGHSYKYAEGAVAFPDPLHRPSRTIITSEGGAGASRTRHAVSTDDGRIRRLTPEELEELNGFPRGFTKLDGLSGTQRAFLMGNALVTTVVTRIGLAMTETPTGLHMD